VISYPLASAARAGIEENRVQEGEREREREREKFIYRLLSACPITNSGLSANMMISLTEEDSICNRIYIYTYTHIYTHTHTHIYIYIYIFAHVASQCGAIVGKKLVRRVVCICHKSLAMTTREFDFINAP